MVIRTQLQWKESFRKQIETEGDQVRSLVYTFIYSANKYNFSWPSESAFTSPTLIAGIGDSFAHTTFLTSVHSRTLHILLSLPFKVSHQLTSYVLQFIIAFSTLICKRP